MIGNKKLTPGLHLTPISCCIVLRPKMYIFVITSCYCDAFSSVVVCASCSLLLWLLPLSNLAGSLIASLAVPAYQLGGEQHKS